VLDQHWIDVYTFGGDKPTNGILIVIEQTGLREYIEYKKILSTSPLRKGARERLSCFGLRINYNLIVS